MIQINHGDDDEFSGYINRHVTEAPRIQPRMEEIIDIISSGFLL